MTDVAVAPARTGHDTRQALLNAARLRFSLHPYRNVSLREIAADVGVSAALVVKYFGTKDELLRQAATFDDVFDAMLAAPNPMLGRHLINALLDHDSGENSRDPLLALMFMGAGRDAPAWVRDELFAKFVSRLEARLTGRNQRIRAEMICAQLLGVSAMRRVFRGPAVTNACEGTIASLVAPGLQALVDGDA